MNSKSYIHVISSCATSLLSERPYQMLQQDNAPIHVSKETMAFLQANQVGLAEHPPYSPDLNPIEELWEILKSQIDPEQYKTYDAFVDGLRVIWDMIP